jgi:hypothetical protein
MSHPRSALSALLAANAVIVVATAAAGGGDRALAQTRLEVSATGHAGGVRPTGSRRRGRLTDALSHNEYRVLNKGRQ